MGLLVGTLGLSAVVGMLVAEDNRQVMAVECMLVALRIIGR